MAKDAETALAENAELATNAVKQPAVPAEAQAQEAGAAAAQPTAPAEAGEKKVAPDDDDMFAVNDGDGDTAAVTEGAADAVKVEAGSEAPQATDAEEEDTAEDGTKKGKKRKKKRLDWVTEPNKFLYLDVYSGGKLIEQIALGAKSRYVIGRDKSVGILMMHPSISRKHAAICHGVPPGTTDIACGATLVDLKGGNGTFYSKSYPCRGSRKARVTPGTGQVLKEGTCFRFGESSRSFVVRGLAGATATTVNNPNFKKKADAREIALSHELGLENAMKKKARKVGPTFKNPFKQASYSSNQTNLMLPTLTEAAPKLKPGETTFSFHKRGKSELDNIKFQHEHLNRKRVLELKAKQAKAEKSDARLVKAEKSDN